MSKTKSVHSKEAKENRINESCHKIMSVVSATNSKLLRHKKRRKPIVDLYNCTTLKYRSGTVNSKSSVGKVLLRIKWKFELN